MWTDLVYWFFTPLVTKTLGIIAVVVVAVILALSAGVPLDGEHLRELARRSTWFGELPTGLQVLLVFALGDFVGYWLHRAFHGRWLWKFHAIHHSSQDLDWLSATRLHPVNEILARALQAIPLIALGFDTRVVAAFVPFIGLYAIALHANVRWTFGPLRYVIASPTFHRWHHTSEDAGLDKNFAGLFPIWDLLFGTFYLPAGQQPERFGVSDPVPDGIVGQMLYPFRRERTMRAP
jgi:sterol desaturase/sphingolipid hydroxylase (fatty acid hydroxylase superfamily)